ncbi:UDP-glucose 4-epimerase GalE [uncultured Modestobacter sp.]|uniref:UDP-glucose 4-epimerase GalE n=1 Tax=uncultured Modestobacter sp. TaxID=380048 RepID=UPI0026266EDB|nr:UDP-glucose 4-epimerase GalE [uncultured Modestobacter sp.]
MCWLITGAAGYIGAHVTRAMLEAGEEVVAYDDLSTGDAARVADVELVQGSVLDADLLGRVLRRRGVHGVVHIAAKKQVEESVHRPLYYYEQNVEGLRRVLEALTRAEVGTFLFSSSAAVYGAPDVPTVTEDVPCAPVNPYGTTKLVGERIVTEVAAATGLRFANLRYFNVAGALEPGLADAGTSNLVPMVFQRLARRQPPLVFGDDYDTPDGTCVRDFVHVGDVASAHVAAAQALAAGRLAALTANVGRGEGVSVREMVDVILSVTGCAGQDWARPDVRPRRAGDPARVVASAQRIEQALGWRARLDVKEMVSSAWAGWNPGGRRG